MDYYTIYDEIADTKIVLSNWENGLYRLIVKANCRPKLYETQMNFILSIREIVNYYRWELVRLLKEAK